MARLLSLAVAALLIVPAALAADAPSTPQAVDLLAAIHSGLLRAEVTSLGFTSGDNAVIALTNLSPQALEVRVAPGTILAPENAGAAPVAVRRVSGKTLAENKVEVIQAVVLAPRGSARYTLQGFSIDCGRPDPPAKAKLTPTGIDPVLTALFHRADAGTYDLPTIQAAVWLHFGGLTEERLTRRLKIDNLGLLDARDLLRQAEEEAGNVK